MEKIYCLKCRGFTKSENLSRVTIYVRGNRRNQLKALCYVCKSKKCKFIPDTCSDSDSE